MVQFEIKEQEILLRFGRLKKHMYLFRSNNRVVMITLWYNICSLAVVVVELLVLVFGENMMLYWRYDCALMGLVLEEISTIGCFEVTFFALCFLLFLVHVVFSVIVME